MFDLKTQLFNFSSSQQHPKNTFTFGIAKIAPPLPSSNVNDKFFLLSVTQTELNDMVDDGGDLITSKPIFGKGQKEYNHFYRRPSIPFKFPDSLSPNNQLIFVVLHFILSI